MIAEADRQIGWHRFAWVKLQRVLRRTARGGKSDNRSYIDVVNYNAIIQCHKRSSNRRLHIHCTLSEKSLRFCDTVPICKWYICTVSFDKHVFRKIAIKSIDATVGLRDEMDIGIGS